MPKDAVIALDAMGGDNAPGSVLRGVNTAAERFPNLRWQLFGDEAVISKLAAEQPRLKDRYEVIHTPDHIADTERPSVALRSGKKSSMWQAIQSVADGKAEAVVSGGNTGALMAISRFILRSPEGIDRPAMISFFPTARGETAMLDLGANVDSGAKQLVQFAVMGAIFARSVLGMPHPVVGLLNNGAESSKGRDSIKEAAQILRSGDYPFTFHGFVEGNEITTGAVDVVVTDGFTGNIALKTAEGTAELYSHFMRGAFQSSWTARIGYFFAKKALSQLSSRVDPRRYNGAVFAGLNGVVVKSHGGSDAFGFANAIGMAADMVEQGFMADIRKECERLNWNHVQAAPAAPA
jgi:glycerol-3-phosphate acyltransferase PlsX